MAEQAHTVTRTNCTSTGTEGCMSADWGATELETRIADLAAMKRGEMTLATVQARAKDRRSAAGLSRGEAARAMHEAARERRRTAATGEA